MRDELIEKIITSLGVAPTLKARAVENLQKLSDDELKSKLTFAEDLEQRARNWLNEG